MHTGTATAAQELLTAAEAAEQLGLNRQYLTRLVRHGKLQAVRKLPGLRGAYLFAPEDVQALADERNGR